MNPEEKLAKVFRFPKFLRSGKRKAVRNPGTVARNQPPAWTERQGPRRCRVFALNSSRARDLTATRTWRDIGSDLCRKWIIKANNRFVRYGIALLTMTLSLT